MNTSNNSRRGQPGGALPRFGSSGNIPAPKNNLTPTTAEGSSRGVPRALSSGALGMPGGQVGGGTASVVPMETESPPKVSNPNPDPWSAWGDDDDDEVWGGSEMDHFFSQLECPVLKVTPEEEKDLNLPTATEDFFLRRQYLEGRSQENGALCSSSVLIEESPVELQRKLKALETEKQMLIDTATKSQGEVTNLRRWVKDLQTETKEINKKKMELAREANEMKDKLEERHRQEITKLKAELRELHMDLNKERMSRSFSQSSQSPKPAGPAPPGPSTSNINLISDTPPPPIKCHDNSPSVAVALTPTRIPEGKTFSTTTTQAISIPFENSESMNSPATNNTSLGPDDEEVKITWPKLSSTKVTLDVEEDDEDPPSSRVRDKVFRSIERMVDLRFQLNLPLLESIVKRAPKEIMRRLVRQPEEIKSVFPDMVDYMYLWGIDKERKKVRAAMRLAEPPRVPTLPQSDAGGWEDFFRTVLAIEIRMREDGIWGGLMEVKDALEELLNSVAGTEGRVKMYERPTLGRLWKLLAWAEELWRCIVIEEESDPELVNKHKQKWTEELEAWTGLVLKTDWRDYFFLELEVEVRKFSLSILASIAAAGYFEHKTKRYVILGRILTDVLTSEVFSKDMKNIRHVLKILTFTVCDLTVLRSLCHRNSEGKCLAKLLGDGVAQVLRSSDVDGAAKTLIYFDFLLFLNALTRENPMCLIQSNVAVKNRERKKKEESEKSNAVDMKASNNTGASTSTLPSTFDCSMDIDSFVMSQFACPIRYSAGSDNIRDASGPGATTSKTKAKTEEESLCEDSKFWLDPTFYEDPYGAGETRCQCRRNLVACAVIGLKVTFDLWLKAELDHQKYLDRLDSEEFAELRKLRNIFELTDNKRRERAICLHEGIEDSGGDANVRATEIEEATKRLEKRYADIKAKREEMKSLEQEVTKIFRLRGRGAPIIEWNWNNVVQRQTEICGLLGKSSLPAWTLEMRRSPGILEECLAKAASFLSFIETRSENIAATMGSEAYKVYMGLLPLLRVHVDQFDISRVDKTLLLSLTNDCDDDSYTPPLAMQTSQLYNKVTEQERNNFNSQTYSDLFNWAQVHSNLKPLSAETLQKLKQRGDEEVARMRKLPLPSKAEDEALMAALEAYELNNF